jgi:glutathione S-transferase
MTLRLINARPSPYGRKVAIALREKGIAYDVQYDQPWGEGTCTPEYSPLQQLPILILEDGETVYESGYILDWLELRYPDPPLLPAEVEPQIEARRLKMLGERLMEVIHTITFELQRPDPASAWIERQTRKVSGALDEIDRRIGSRRRAVSGPIDLGDIAVGSSLLVVDFLIANQFVPALDVLDWKRSHPGLAEYAGLLDQRPSFIETRPAMMDVDLKAVLA